MGTLCKCKRGKNNREYWFLQFFDSHGQRQSISLPAATYRESMARKLLEVVELLVRHQKNGDFCFDQRLERWIKEACPEIQKKLAKHGFIDLPEIHTCKELWTTYLLNETDNIEDSTRDLYERTRGYFFEFFKPKELITDLDKSRFEEWKDFLLTKRELAESTVAGTLSKARAVFNWAVKTKWLPESPMKGIARGDYENRENDRFIEMEEYHRLLAACNCQEWRAILALVRIGGLRAPSEVMRLRWQDIDWENNKFSV